VEALFRPEIFQILSNDFWVVPAGKHRNLIGIYRKKSGKFSDRNTSVFQRFPVLSCKIGWPDSSSWDIMRRLEIPTAYNIMSSTTPQKLLNGKYVKEAGNQLEFCYLETL
jgi:hypothetical protein